MPPNNLLVSFIIPVYNAAAFINEAYQNILDQGVSDIEILFVDNNSIDNSVYLIRELVEKDRRVKLFHEKKQGAAAARNKGILESSGEFIHFFDVDDLLYTDAIPSLLNVLKEHIDVMSVFGNRSSSYQRTFDSNFSKNKNIKIYKKQSKLTYIWLKDKSKLVGPPAFLHRREIVKKIGGFREDLLLGEDAFFHIRLSSEFQLAHIETNIYHYFRHSNSTVSLDNRKQRSKVFTYWPPLVKVYLPYVLDQEVSQRFKNIIYGQIYGSMGKMLLFSNSIVERKQMLSNNIRDVNVLNIPFLISLFLNVLVFIPNKILYKFYWFYIVRKIYHEKG